MIYYAGIGSRETPETILGAFAELGRRLVAYNCVLRSGRAGGADSAFERGCIEAGGQAIRMAEDAGIHVFNAHGCENCPDTFVEEVINYVAALVGAH